MLAFIRQINKSALDTAKKNTLFSLGYVKVLLETF